MHRLGAVALLTWLALAGSSPLAAPGSLSGLETSTRSALAHVLPPVGCGIGAWGDSSPGPETDVRSEAFLAQPATSASAAGGPVLGYHAVDPRRLHALARPQRGPPAPIA